MIGNLPGNPGASESNRPVPVEEAERFVRKYGLALGSVGAGVTLWYWTAVLQEVPIMPLGSWLVFLIGLTGIFFYPPTRKARRARELIDSWDSLLIDSRLAAAGATDDPRFRVAEAMAARIRSHPSTDEALLRTTSQLMSQLGVTLRDIRTIELTQDAHGAGLVEDQIAGSLRDTLDFIEARAGELLTRLEGLHRVVILRDASELPRVHAEADEILHRLTAEREVERLLNPRSDS